MSVYGQFCETVIRFVAESPIVILASLKMRSVVTSVHLCDLVHCMTERAKEVKVVKTGLYVIYKPWLGGVFRLYRTQDRGQRKFAVNIPQAEGEGYI